MTRKSLNVAMLDKVEDVITRFPKRHDQNYWRVKLTGRSAALNGAPARECGTSMCIAGWVAELDRGRWAFPLEHLQDHLLIARQDEIDDDVVLTERGPKGELLVTTFTRAQRVLGINDYEAQHLFVNLTTKRAVKNYFRTLKRYHSAV